MEEIQKKFSLYYQQLSGLWDVVTTLCVASIYTQKAYEDYQVHLVFMISFLFLVGYFVYRVKRNKGFFDYSFQQYKITFHKPLSRSISLFVLVVLILRFVLPEKIVFYLQNIFYVAALLLLLIGIIYLLIKNRP